ncbi:MAG TPA: hypothetical protein VG095_05585 [Chthoniobacterales bacterium]|nr:hypothetical protein [Chthoniobacterales bacterium]
MLPRERCQRFLLGALLLHLTFVLLTSLNSAFSALAVGHSFFPPSARAWLADAQEITSLSFRQKPEEPNLAAQIAAFYMHGAGIDTGYGFFAPGVAVTHKLVFQLQYPDGRIEHELPAVGGSAIGLRMPLLLDNIARAPHEGMREAMLKMMAFAVWREHRDAAVIRAVFGIVNLPDISEYERGVTASYEPLYAYDFRFGSPAAKPELE